MTKASSHIGEVIIEARDIVKRFGGALAVENVSLAVREGEIHAVVGENGAGKSTLMRILAGIIEQDSGQVVITETGAQVLTRFPAQELFVANPY